MTMVSLLRVIIARHLANRVSSSLNHRCLDDRQSLERARHELKKKACDHCSTHISNFPSIKKSILLDVRCCANSSAWTSSKCRRQGSL